MCIVNRYPLSLKWERSVLKTVLPPYTNLSRLSFFLSETEGMPLHHTSNESKLVFKFFSKLSHLVHRFLSIVKPRVLNSYYLCLSCSILKIQMCPHSDHADSDSMATGTLFAGPMRPFIIWLHCHIARLSVDSDTFKHVPRKSL